MPYLLLHSSPLHRPAPLSPRLLHCPAPLLQLPPEPEDGVGVVGLDGALDGVLYAGHVGLDLLQSAGDLALSCTGQLVLGQQKVNPISIFLTSLTKLEYRSLSWGSGSCLLFWSELRI